MKEFSKLRFVYLKYVDNWSGNLHFFFHIDTVTSRVRWSIVLGTQTQDVEVTKSLDIFSLVYTKTVESVFRAPWLATQPPDIQCYSPIHLSPMWQAFGGEGKGSFRCERNARAGAREEGGKETPARKPLFWPSRLIIMYAKIRNCEWLAAK